MDKSKGMRTLQSAFEHDLREKWHSKDELEAHLQWVLDRADKYAKLCGTTREKVIDAWEAKRYSRWMDFYQECNQPNPDRMAGHPVILYADWLKEGCRLYGPDMLDWRLKCPACGHVQTVREFKEKGVYEDNAFTCCASRFGLGGEPDCRWTTGGLLHIGGVYVIRPDFFPVLAFAFADKTPVKDRIKAGDAVRIYHAVNQPEPRVGEAKEILPGGTVKVVFATVDILTGETTIETRLVSPELVAVHRSANDKLHSGGGVIKI